jgi:hypothetical protein
MAVLFRRSHPQEHPVSPAAQIDFEDLAAAEIVREFEMHPSVLGTGLASR